MDISQTIVAKSDQLNAQDLIAGPVTITITDVAVNTRSDQPVSIKSNGGLQPYKPCKTMRRLLAAIWGTETDVWRGRKLTLYLDPGVKWAGSEVGGVRISQASHIDGKKEVPLRVNRHQVVVHEVQPIAAKADEAQVARIMNAFKRYSVTKHDVCRYIGIDDEATISTEDVAKMTNIGLRLKNGEITADEIKQVEE